MPRTAAAAPCGAAEARKALHLRLAGPSDGDGEEKGAPLSQLALDPYPPALSLYNLIGDGQADPRSRVLISCGGAVLLEALHLLGADDLAVLLDPFQL